MNLFGVDVPTWVLDWTGSALVVASLPLLVRKRMGYWHLSNASLVPYFLLFLSGRQYLLAGLQASYLVFGVHGLLLWRLEHRRDQLGRGFDERAWYRAGWVLALGILAWSTAATDLVDVWAWWQFTIVALSLVANWATTRRWTWSWPVWLGVNLLQAVYFWHLGLWAQFGLQFVLFGLSVEGWAVWRRADRQREEATSATV